MRRLLCAILFLLASSATAQVTTTPSETGVASPQTAVAITGGTINGAAIGGTTPAAGAFTTLSASSTVTFGSSAVANQALVLNANNGATQGAYIQIFSAGTQKTILGAKAAVTGSGTDQSLLVQSTSDNIQLDAGVGKTVSLSNNSATVLSVTGGTTALTGTITVSAVASSGAAQSGYLCYNTSGGVVTYDGGATCLISREETKTNMGPIAGLPIVLALQPFWGTYRNDTPMSDHMAQPFLGARHTATIDPRLTSHDKEGEPLGVRYDNMVAVLISAIQEQQREIEMLKAAILAIGKTQHQRAVKTAMH